MRQQENIWPFWNLFGIRLHTLNIFNFDRSKALEISYLPSMRRSWGCQVIENPLDWCLSSSSMTFELSLVHHTLCQSSVNLDRRYRTSGRLRIDRIKSLLFMAFDAFISANATLCTTCKGFKCQLVTFDSLTSYWREIALEYLVTFITSLLPWRSSTPWQDKCCSCEWFLPDFLFLNMKLWHEVELCRAAQPMSVPLLIIQDCSYFSCINRGVCASSLVRWIVHISTCCIPTKRHWREKPQSKL